MLVEPIEKNGYCIMKKNTYEAIELDIQHAPKVPPETVSRFFKTGHATYSAHDQFLGLQNPIIRKIAKEHPHTPLEDIQKLLMSPYNEKRLLGLIILVHQYQRSKSKAEIVEFYCNHLDQVNNWNLVDLSAHYILGDYLIDQDRSKLYTLSQSKNLWHRRIAVLSTFAFIRKNDFKDILALSCQLKYDPEDLMHKAIGWMLREVGKQDVSVLKAYLDEHAQDMPRTMLRYAIEKLSKDLQKHYRDKKASEKEAF